MVAVVVLATGCQAIGRRVVDDAAPTRISYAGTAGIAGSIISNPTSPQPFQCVVNLPATNDLGQCGPVHYQGRGVAVALPAACVSWLRQHWVHGAVIDQASDASVQVLDPASNTVLAAETDLMDLAWGLQSPAGIYGAQMWPAHVYFTYEGLGQLQGGGLFGWTYNTPRIPKLARYWVTVSCVTAGDASSGYTRSVTRGAITIA